MFVTGLVQEQIEATLRSLEERVRVIEKLNEKPAGWACDDVLCNAAERAFHIAVECVTDVGNDLIDALVMRDAGGYADIVKVLAEEHVVSTAWYEKFLGAVEFRQRLIREYNRVTPDETEGAIRAYSSLFPTYASFIRDYVRASRS